MTITDQARRTIEDAGTGESYMAVLRPLVERLAEDAPTWPEAANAVRLMGASLAVTLDDLADDLAALERVE